MKSKSAMNCGSIASSRTVYSAEKMPFVLESVLATADVCELGWPPYDWTAFETAHIFPLEKKSLWMQFNYGRWVTDMDETVGISKINSLQNGFRVHRKFDQHLVSVNPDVSSSQDSLITLVGKGQLDNFGYDGSALDHRVPRSNKPRVSDRLLQWHFRQSVLANMRGAGEPVFEHDFPPGTDMLKEIRKTEI